MQDHNPGLGDHLVQPPLKAGLTSKLMRDRAAAVESSCDHYHSLFLML